MFKAPSLRKGSEHDCRPSDRRARVAQEPGLTPTTIKIGMFGPLSGPSMAYGFDVMNAARMYYDKINKDGGIHGRKLEVVLQDDRCNANDLVAAVKKLVEQDQVFILNGGSCSAAVVAGQGLRGPLGRSVVHAERLRRRSALSAAAKHLRRLLDLPACDGRLCCRVRHQAA